MFKITNGSGFHITFSNGYTISVQFGWGSYCEHHDEIEGFNPTIDPQAHDIKLGSKGSKDAEIAIIDPNGKLLNFKYLDSEEGDSTVKGYCCPEEVSKWIKYITPDFASLNKNPECTWTKEEDPGGVEYYETSCKDAFLFAEGDCKDNRYNFCPKCGKTIKESKND